MEKRFYVPKLGSILKVFSIFLISLFVIGSLGGLVVNYLYIQDFSFVELLLKTSFQQKFLMIIKALPVSFALSMICSFFIIFNLVFISDDGIKVQNIFTNNIYLHWDSIVECKDKKIPGIGLKYKVLYSDNPQKRIWVPLFLNESFYIEKTVMRKITKKIL